MKAIFFSLLVINSVLACWIFFSSSQSSNDDLVEPLSIKSLSASVADSADAIGEVDGPMCVLVGPFTNLAQGDILVERLAALEIKAELQSIPVPTQKAFWVYLPPQESREQALNLLAELQAQSIDSFVIPKGELANGISLGLFNDRARALAKQGEMQSVGYSVEIKEELRTIEQSWVIASAKETSALSTEAWISMIEDLENVGYKQNYCPTVASSQ